MFLQVAILMTRLINHVNAQGSMSPPRFRFSRVSWGALQISIVFQVAIIANSWGNQEMIKAANFLAPVSCQWGLAMVLIDS